MQARDFDRRIFIEPQGGARPPEQQPAGERCEDCGCLLSRYRGPRDTRCQTCQRSHGSVAVAIGGLCWSCGKDEHLDPESSWCYPCILEADGKRACRCESCGRWYGFKSGSKASSMVRCSTCREADRVERFTAKHGVHPRSVEGRKISGLRPRSYSRRRDGVG